MKGLALMLVPALLQAQSATMQSSAFTKGFKLTSNPVVSIEGHLPLPDAGTSRLFISYTHSLAASGPVALAPGLEIGKDWGDKQPMEVAAGYRYSNLFQPKLDRIHEVYAALRTHNAEAKAAFVPNGGGFAEIFLYHTDTTSYGNRPFTVGLRYGLVERYFTQDSSHFYGGVHASAPILALGSAELALTADAQLRLQGTAQNAAAVGVTLRPRRKER